MSGCESARWFAGMSAPTVGADRRVALVAERRGCSWSTPPGDRYVCSLRSVLLTIGQRRKQALRCRSTRHAAASAGWGLGGGAVVTGAQHEAKPSEIASERLTVPRVSHKIVAVAEFLGEVGASGDAGRGERDWWGKSIAGD